MDHAHLPYRPCVGLMVLNRQGMLWIGRRSGAALRDAPGGWWQMPQGGIDAGETPAEAAMRELAEETGIRTAHIIAESQNWHAYDLPAELIGKIWDGKFRGQTQKWFAIRFDGAEAEIDIAPPGHSQEFEAWRWADINDVLASIVPFKRQVYAEIIAEFRHLAEPSRI